MMCVEVGERGEAKVAMSQPFSVANSQWWEKKKRKERSPGKDGRETSIAGSLVEEGQAGLEEGEEAIRTGMGRDSWGRDG